MRAPPLAIGAGAPCLAGCDTIHQFASAASMPEEVARRWKKALGLDMHEGYGLTESTPFSTYNHEVNHKFGSVGTAIMNVEVQIIGEGGKKQPPGEPGEIHIRGPNIMKEYFGKPEETAAAVSDGWLSSGDIGYLDDEGYLFLVDRLKDMINNAGLKVWPREVEEVIGDGVEWISYDGSIK